MVGARIVFNVFSSNVFLLENLNCITTKTNGNNTCNYDDVDDDSFNNNNGHRRHPQYHKQH